MTSLALDSMSGNQPAFQSAAVPLTFNKDVKLSSVTMHGYGSGTGTLTAQAYVYRVSDQTRIATGTVTTITGTVLDYTFPISVILSANVEYRIGVEMTAGTSFYWNAGNYASGGYPHAYANTVATGTASSAGFAGSPNAYPTTAMSAYSASYGTPVRSIDISIPNAAPNAPTITVPTTPDSTQPVPISWIHNDPEGDAQTAWEVGYLASGASTWTITTGADASSSYNIPANALKFGTTYTVRVRTGDAANGLTGAYASKTFTTADPNTYETDVLSSTRSASISTVGRPTGGYQYDVRAYDGETWSDWVSGAAFTIPATISVSPATGTGGSAPPVVGQASVNAVPSAASGAAVVPLYSTQHVINTPSSSAAANIVTVEPIWTWLNEQTGVASSAPQAVIDTDGWVPNTYQWSVRTSDGDLWSPWTDGQTFTIPPTIAAPVAAGAATAPAPVVGQSSVYAPSASASATAVVPVYSTQHIINAPAGTAGAAETAPEPIWTWLDPVIGAAAYAAYVVPESWKTGLYQFEVRTYDGDLWSNWSDVSTPTTYIIQSVRVFAATGSAQMVAPTIDAGARVPSAAAAGLATVPQYNVSVRFNAPSATALAAAVAPVFALAYRTEPVPPMSALGMLRKPRITPALTNVSILSTAGIWEPTTRSILESGAWNAVGETHVLV